MVLRRCVDCVVVYFGCFQAGSEEVDGGSTQLEVDNLGSSPGSISNDTIGSKDGAEVVNNEESTTAANEEAVVTTPATTPVVESSSSLPSPRSESNNNNPTSSSTLQPPPQKAPPPRALTHEEKKEQCLKKPDKLIPCPRCESVDTKFCYYNNYNINQPRHFCKSCQRYWTAGGTLRNVLVGAGRRKNKYGVAQSKQEGTENLTAVRMDHHEPAQQSLVMNPYGGTVPPMNLPRHGVVVSPRTVISDSQAGSTVTTTNSMGLASAFKPLGTEISSDSVSKLRQRTQTNSMTTTADVKGGDCASSGETTQTNTYVLSPREAAAAPAMWTKSGAPPLGFFNGAWPYGYNIGWSGPAGAIPGVAPALCAPHSASLGSAATPSPVWTGMWASAAPVPTFGWNMLQGGWTLPWRPVPAVGVQMQGQGVASSSSRKREAPSISEGDTRKIPRVGSGEEAVAV